MTATFIGVRHHSPACARLVAATIESLSPAYVLVEGPAEFNDRLDELLLGHDLPIAVFSSYRDGERYQASWAPLCAYSPEWVALTSGRAGGAQVRFIDLPAWHPAFSGRRNRYADAERRYVAAVDHLRETFAMDDSDALWDHLFEVGSDGGEGLTERLSAYFDLLRGESAASDDDAAREAYMARWVRTAVARAGDRPVVVVTGGLHQPALRTLAGQPATEEPDAETDPEGWPAVPAPDQDAAAESFLVPYSFQRMDSFTGYQSGMPSPEYYQRLWSSGPRDAAAGLIKDAVRWLRQLGQPVSTADLIAANTMVEGLARLRGHPSPARTDVLDGLVSALVTEDLGQRLPWSSGTPPTSGAHPVVAELVAAFRGDRTGRLHPDTPAPPLVHHVAAELTALGLDRVGTFTLDLDLAVAWDLRRSRALHRLRVLEIPGFKRRSGPSSGADLARSEHWHLSPSELRLPRLIEAGGYGATLHDASAAVLREQVGEAEADVGHLAEVLFDAALCGLVQLSEETATSLDSGLASANDLGELGQVLASVLGLWRHDRLLGTAGSTLFGAVITAGVARILWLAEGVHSGPAPADASRLAALTAVRDALVHAGPRLGLDRAAALGTARRISADTTAPPDLRGAAFGLCWSLGEDEPGEDADGDGAADPLDPRRALAQVTDPAMLGDWLAGLFALARSEVLGSGAAGPLTVLDSVVADMSANDFLVALPALRQAFEYFPPRERESIARGLLDRRGLRGSARALTRTVADPVAVAAGMALEARVTQLLDREGLGVTPGPTTEGGHQ